MSELTLTLLRLGLLVALWLFVFGVLSTLRRDLQSDGRIARPRLAPKAQYVPEKRRRHSRRGAHIVVTLTDGTSRRIELTAEPISFGKGDDNTVILSDDYTSTHHARITSRERGWAIDDLGSTNGTWVDRRRITTSTPLHPGMHIRIGRTEISVAS